LLSALGDVLEHQVDVPGVGTTPTAFLPVVLHITGLPDLLNRATNVDTFRRRFQTLPLSLFEDREVIDALLDTRLPGGVTFAPAAATQLAEMVAGDPYLFQLVGKHAWDASAGRSCTVSCSGTARPETSSDWPGSPDGHRRRRVPTRPPGTVERTNTVTRSAARG
jgi:hypothetical protein